MSKTLIVSTSSIQDELRGPVVRLNSLNKAFNSGSNHIYVPTFFRSGSYKISTTNVKYFPISLLDILMMPYYYFLGYPLSNLIYRRRKIKKKLIEFDRVIFHLIRTIQDYKSSDSIVIDMCESLSKNFYARALSMNKLSIKRNLFIYESKRLKDYEHKICSLEIEKKLFISKNDTLIKVCKNYKILPNVPSFEIKKITSYKFDPKKTVFLGHVDYEPNLISIRDTSMYLNQIDPKIKLHVVGRYNSSSEKYLQEHKNIILHGFVEKMDDIFENVLCGFSIIKNGTGMQNKVLDYFSYSFPSIVSSEVQNGLPFSSPAIVCDNISQIKDGIDQCSNLNIRKKLINSGHDYLKQINTININDV